MKAIYTIAFNTYREIIRDRILYGLVVFALLTIGLSLALGQLSFAEQSRISINFGFSAMHLSVVILSVFVGATLVSREIEKRTILTLLSRPLTRSGFIIGKFFGLSLIIASILIGLSVVLALVLKNFNMSWNQNCYIAVIGTLLEAEILLALTLLFGSFLRPLLTVTFSMSLFLIGHWLDSMNFFARDTDSAFFSFLNQICQRLLPNFERMNWRGLAILNEAPDFTPILQGGLYSISWIVFLLSATCIVFWRRDFV